MKIAHTVSISPAAIDVERAAIESASLYRVPKPLPVKDLKFERFTPKRPSPLMNPQPIVGPTHPDKLAQVRGVQLHPGAPTHGRLVQLGVMHLASTTRNNTLMFDITVASQLRALDALFALKPKHLFVESLSFDFYTPSAEYSQDTGLRRLFEHWRPGQPLNANQKQGLLTLSAPRLYTMLSGASLEVHKTISLRLNEELAKALNATTPVAPELLLMHDRDHFLMDELKQFFAHNATDEAVLIYGATHDLTRYFGKEAFCSPQFFFSNLSGLTDKELKQIRHVCYA